MTTKPIVSFRVNSNGVESIKQGKREGLAKIASDLIAFKKSLPIIKEKK